MPAYNLPLLPHDFEQECTLTINGQAQLWTDVIQLLEGSVCKVTCGTTDMTIKPSTSNPVVTTSDNLASSLSSKRPRLHPTTTSSSSTTSQPTLPSPPPGLDVLVAWFVTMLMVHGTAIRGKLAIHHPGTQRSSTTDAGLYGCLQPYSEPLSCLRFLVLQLAVSLDLATVQWGYQDQALEMNSLLENRTRGNGTPFSGPSRVAHDLEGYDGGSHGGQPCIRWVRSPGKWLALYLFLNYITTGLSLQIRRDGESRTFILGWNIQS